MTDRPPLEVADVFRQYAEPYLARHGASPQQRRVMRDIQACRTAALGGHVDACDRRGHEAISYNSCRNRHCPKCQGPARARWLDARAGELRRQRRQRYTDNLPETPDDRPVQTRVCELPAQFHFVTAQAAMARHARPADPAYAQTCGRAARTCLKWCTNGRRNHTSTSLAAAVDAAPGAAARGHAR